MKNSQKGFAPVALIVILVILAGGGYILVKKLKVDSSKQEAKEERNVTTETQTQVSGANEQNQTVTNETKDWKTYRSDQCGVEFKYPDEWGDFYAGPRTVTSKTGGNITGFDISFGSSKGPSMICYPPGAKLTFDYFIQGSWVHVANNVPKPEYINIQDAIKAAKLTEDSDYGRNEVYDPTRYIEVGIQKKDGGVIVVTIVLPRDKTLKDRSDQFNLFLSNLKVKFTVTASLNTQVGSASNHLVGFERAVNINNWVESQKYLSDKVYVVLEGSSCCGEKNSSDAAQSLKNFEGIKLTFDNNSNLVKEYLDYINSQYPSGRKFGAVGQEVNFNNLVIGVENDPNQPYKATIGYKVENGKITLLFINPGRDK
ncbi:MAG: hypothetical protein Q7R65_01625 [bacterium]|nr:hypothetical protein [bacterium]